MNMIPKIAKPRPILRYHGGKWLLAPWIISHFPKHKVYTEAFGGAASVLLRKERCYAEIYNDLDDEIVNVFNVIMSQGDKLKTILEFTPFARSVYYDAYRPSKSSLAKAANTIVKSYMGFGSDAITRKSGFRSNSNRSGTTPSHDWVNYPNQIDFFIKRLRGVTIENRPAHDILQRHDSPDTLHFVDPPYIHSTRSTNKAYKFEMENSEHEALSLILKQLQGKVIVCGYESDLYNDSTLNGERKRETLKRSMGRRAGEK